MNGDNKDSFSYHWVAVRDASTSHVASHHFKMKDSIMEEIFKMMYKNNLNEWALPFSKIMVSGSEVSIENWKSAYFGESNCGERWSLCSSSAISR